MKEKVMSAMQAFSKAMFMPVLILPIAGLLIAVGNVLTNARLMEILPFLDNPVTKGFGTILSGALVAILNNLGLIFCTGIAIGLAKKKKAEAGFTALLAFLVFINAMNKFMGLRGMLVDADALRGSGQAVVLGIQILDMGVFLGIILGCVSAYVHNRFIDTEFNNAFQIYGGARFVFIVLIPVIIILAVVLTYVWPPVQMVIDSLGYFINRTGNFGIFIYGALERLLIPTGLHHLVYTPFLYTKTGWYRADCRSGIRRLPKYLLCGNGRSVYPDLILFCSMGCKRTFKNVWSGWRMPCNVSHSKTRKPSEDQSNPDPGCIYILYCRCNRTD